MIAFDSDVLSLVWDGTEPYRSKAAQIASEDWGVPVVTAEEALRGRLDQVRRAEAGRGRLSLPDAYRFLEITLSALRVGVYLQFTSVAEQLVVTWRAAKIRVKPMDMRIAAIAISNNATLVTRNVQDFKLIPGLKLDIWP